MRDARCEMRGLVMRIRVWGLVFGLGLVGCSDGTAPVVEDPDGSFAQLQAKVLTPTCAGCHTAGSAVALQSGLVLTADQSYRNLVNAQPANANAKADGMLRVKPFDPINSLLFHKLQWAGGHHARDYGSPMPLGTQSLSVGQIEFVRKWIEAGAPPAGAVADVNLLSDRTPPPTTVFEPLPVPARGYQLRIEPFIIQPNFEREIFVYKAVGNPRTEYVSRIETRMRSNSHHLLVHSFRSNTPAFLLPRLNTVRDIRNADGTLNVLNLLPMGYHVFFAGSMTPSNDYRLPAGVALRLPAQTQLDLNSHYVNRSNAPITGEAYVNLHTVDSAQVQHVASTLELGNTALNLPPRTRTTVTTPFTTDKVMRIFMLTSHMHERGEKFVIRISGGARNGEIIYTATDWASPGIVTFDTPLVLQPGQGLISEVTYNNTTDRTIGFGLTSQDEMNIIFGYYY